MEDVKDMAARVHALGVAEKLRLAANLYDDGRVDVAHLIARAAESELVVQLFRAGKAPL